MPYCRLASTRDAFSNRPATLDAALELDPGMHTNCSKG